MPYVLASAGLRQLIAGGDDIFIRGILDPEINQYDIYRVGKVYGANQGLAAENTEIVNIGQVQIISKQGDISRAKVLNSNGLIKKGDIIVRPQTLRFKPLYYLAAAPAGIKGQIIGAVDDAYKIARHDGVVVNLGSASSVYAGHIFSVLKKAEKVQDPRTNELITIGNQIIAELMIVNVFENLSYGIVLNAAEIVSVGDVIIGIE
jgi:hypothetical protein